jgi:hypothetical protein
LDAVNAANGGPAPRRVYGSFAVWFAPQSVGRGIKAENKQNQFDLWENSCKRFARIDFLFLPATPKRFPPVPVKNSP